MTAWTPVSEAAALLGVSERTIWRRIKSETIDSRSESGRTLVRIEHDEDTELPIRSLSSVAAQLAMRKLDVDGLADVMAMVRDYRSALEAQARQSRRAARVTSLVALLLVAGLVVGGWYHFKTVRGMSDTHTQALADLRVRQANELADYKAQAQRDAALAGDRGRQVEQLQRLTAQQQAHLAEVETTRRKFTERLDDRLGQFASVASTDKKLLLSRDQEVTTLRDQVASLRARLSGLNDTTRRARDVDHKYTEAVRRAAARSRGLAKGLEIHLAYQKEIEQRLRRELAMRRTAQDAMAGNQQPATRDDSSTRRELLDAIIREPSTGQSESVSQPISEAPTGWRLIWRYLRAAVLPPPKPGDPAIALAD